MNIIRAAAVQISPVLYSREGTVDKVVQKIIELGRQGVQCATLPETVVPYYPSFCFVQRPFEMAGVEGDDGRSSLTYVKPSSLMVVETNDALLAAAENLDAKLRALGTKVTTA